MASSLTPNGETPANQTPVSTMNMTPLIDVLLVLLVMLIITIPIAAHSVEVEVPTSGDFSPDPVTNKVVISEGDAILWNGNQVTEAQLNGLLVATRRMNPEPQLQFEPEAQARYETSAQVLRQIKLSGVTNFGFVGNERYRQFGSGRRTASD
jgi:biopolymer transport protein ExbD